MTASSKYKLIAGLGNPGEEYLNTYHNAGFLFIKSLVPESKFKVVKNFSYAKIGELTVVRPDTFMNQSGSAVINALKYFKIKPGELLVAHDDSDIELGNYKVSKGGSSAGHKGVESIISSLGTNEFDRLRLGIRKTIDGADRLKAEDFVLREISKEDQSALDSVFEDAKLFITA